MAPVSIARNRIAPIRFKRLPLRLLEFSSLAHRLVQQKAIEAKLGQGGADLQQTAIAQTFDVVVNGLAVAEAHGDFLAIKILGLQFSDRLGPPTSLL